MKLGDGPTFDTDCSQIEILGHTETRDQTRQTQVPGPALLKLFLTVTGVCVMLFALALFGVGPFEPGSPVWEFGAWCGLGVPIGVVLSMTAWSVSRKKTLAKAIQEALGPDSKQDAKNP
jgi:hypothetical protein